jgi:hypothetical protein
VAADLPELILAAVISGGVASVLLGLGFRVIEHYDRWLEEYADKREGPNAAEHTGPLYVGPLGYPFPREADAAFRETFGRLRSELYDVAS